MCRKLLERPVPATCRTRLSCDLDKLQKARRGSAGKLLLADRVGDLNAVQSSRGGSERLEPRTCAARVV